jgi:hypothetical protein
MYSTKREETQKKDCSTSTIVLQKHLQLQKKENGKRKERKHNNFTHLRCILRIALFPRSASARPVNPFLHFQKQIKNSINFTTVAN